VTPGRWTIVARRARVQRRPGEAPRERVLVRCVCGQERVVWLQDMQTGRTTGCESRLCAARYLVADEIRTTLTGWGAREHQLLSGLKGPAARHLRSAIEELERERMQSIEQVIESFLRGPREPPALVAMR
jgi:hypothetical protein